MIPKLSKEKALVDFIATLQQGSILQLHNDMCVENGFDTTTEIDNFLLAEHLINFGDSNYNFDCSEFLSERYKEYAFNILSEKYTKEEISFIVDNAKQVDLLMDDWDDILIEVFDKVIGICYDCKEPVFNDAEKLGYNYDTGFVEYICENCGNIFRT